MKRCVEVQAAAAIIAIFASGSTVLGLGPNLLVNPSFENPSGNYVDLPGNSTHLDGWRTILDGVEIITTTDIGLGFPVLITIPDGNQAIDLPPFTRPGGGGIEQTFTTKAGEAYEVSFYIGSIKNHGKDGNGNVDVDVDGTTHSFSFSGTTGDWDWGLRSFQFVADDSLATLQFKSFDDPLQHTASVDGVSVRAIPEASTNSILLISFLTLWGFARRRQGAVPA
jgi:hypothetical protein